MIDWFRRKFLEGKTEGQAAIIDENPSGNERLADYLYENPPDIRSAREAELLLELKKVGQELVRVADQDNDTQTALLEAEFSRFFSLLIDAKNIRMGNPSYRARE